MEYESCCVATIDERIPETWLAGIKLCTLHKQIVDCGSGGGGTVILPRGLKPCCYTLYDLLHLLAPAATDMSRWSYEL